MSKRMCSVILGLLLVSFLALPIWAGGGKEVSAEEERVKLTMFMSNCGVVHPTGVDPSDNWAINIVEDYANVDLELEVPNYTDFKVKTQLLLASGNLPDIIHSYIYNDMLKAADQGAFLDLKSYYDKSAQMKKVCPPASMELAKSPNTGKYWGIPMNTPGKESGWGAIVHYNLLEQYNGGKYPEDVEGYLDFFRWLKKNIPGSLPVVSRVDGNTLFRNSAAIFAWHGITNPIEYRIQDGEVISCIRLPECRAAVEIYRQLYEEGVLDKEFATNPPSAYWQKLDNKSVATQTNFIGQIVPWVDNALKEGHGRIDTYAPRLKRYPPSLKSERFIESTKVFPIVANSHMLAINAKTKHPDLAWKVLEAFASDELRDAQAWGREGKEYNIVDGKRVPTDRLFHKDINDADSHYWTTHLGIIWGYWPSKAKYAVQKTKNPEIFDRVYNSSRWLVESGEKTGLAVKDFMPPMAEITAKQGEAEAMIAQILAKAISGAISMDGYDKMVEEWVKKYGYMDVLRTEWLKEHRNELLDKGVTQVDNQQSWTR